MCSHNEKSIKTFTFLQLKRRLILNPFNGGEMDFFESPKLGVLMIGSLVSFLKHHQSVWMNACPPPHPLRLRGWQSRGL
jgi:hypothetical protein